MMKKVREEVREKRKWKKWEFKSGEVRVKREREEEKCCC